PVLEICLPRGELSGCEVRRMLTLNGDRICRHPSNGQCALRPSVKSNEHDRGAEQKPSHRSRRRSHASHLSLTGIFWFECRAAFAGVRWQRPGRHDADVHDLRPALGARIKELPRGLEISQEALASRAGLQWTYLSDLERGRQTPTVDLVNRLAQA